MNHITTTRGLAAAALFGMSALAQADAGMERFRNDTLRQLHREAQSGLQARLHRDVERVTAVARLHSPAYEERSVATLAPRSEPAR